MRMLAPPVWMALMLLVAACGGGTPAARSSPVPSGAPQPSISTSPLSPSPQATPSPSPAAGPTAAPRPGQSPAYYLPPSLRGVEWSALPTTSRIVALTFDGGSGAQGLAAILATLSRERVPATFFLTGLWVQANPAGARQIAADPGSSIGNHTWDHPYCTALGDQQVRAEVSRAESEIRDVTGRDPRPLFRFPYGDRDARTIALVNSLGYGSIRWTVDTLGWEGTSAGQTAQTVLQRVVSAERPGEIVLMHLGAAPDGSTLDAAALPAVISRLKADGYGFVAIWDFIDGLA